MFTYLLDALVVFGGAATGTIPYFRTQLRKSLRAYWRTEPLEGAHCVLLILLGVWIKAMEYQGFDANVLYAPLLQRASANAYSALFLALGLGSFYAIYFHAQVLRHVIALCCSVLWAFLAFYYWSNQIHVMGVPLCMWFLGLNAKIFARHG